MRALRVLLVVLFIAGVIAVGVLTFQLIAPRETVLVPAEGGTYVEGVVGAPKNLNPLLCPASEVDRDVCSLIFSGLTRLTESGEAQPDLAESWTVSSDGITYTFTLRPDARWEDGEPITAQDVAFTVKLLQDPSFPGLSTLSQAWSDVTVIPVSERTVQFQLSRPRASFLNHTAIGLLPSHLLSGTTAVALPNSPFNLQPVGSGPWRVTSISTGASGIASIELEPSSTYFGARPKLDRLVFRYFPTSAALLDAFRNGEVDGMANLSHEALTEAERLPETVIYTMPQARFAALLFNLRPDSGVIALTEPAVRQALLLALDRPAIIRDVLQGRAVLADTPMIPGTWAWSAEVRLPGRDLERARDLLVKAGYSRAVVAPFNTEVWQKDGEPVSFTLLTPDSGIYPEVARAMAQQWRDLGIPVAVLPVRGLVPNFLARRQFQAALVEILLEGDPDPLALWHGSRRDRGANFTGWDNAEVNEWLEQAHQTLDRAVRIELYQRFQKRFAEELPAIPLYYPAYTYVLSSRVRNVQVGPIVYPSDRFRSLSEWTINLRRVPVTPAPDAAQ
ncbi:MAG: peptide ABC transporter substrate-binding protein [Anaerolineae bacterium]|nr:peptide ABC transporter substrate-binding protein [Thermoflexales bacterium]MDW8395806.1 peptide ABC transporter substrate-binding protein [Anaerolineae bacterium]